MNDALSVIELELLQEPHSQDLGVVYSSEMANTQDQSQRMAALEKQLEKAEDKREKLAEKLNALIVDRVGPVEAKVNQVHGTAKWFVPTIIALLLAILGSGGGIFYKLGRIDQRFELQAQAISAVRTTNNELAAKITVSGPDAAKAVQKLLTTRTKSPLSINEVAAVIDEAASKKIKIPQEAILAAGTNLLAAPVGQGDTAWDSLLKLARYRSVLNEEYAPSPTLSLPIASTEFPNWKLADPHWNSFVRLVGKVPFDRSARLEFLNKPNHSDLPYGPEWSFVYPHDHSIVLDGKLVRNVIFMGGTIEYGGGPLTMEQTYFVNCTFRSSRSASTQKFLTAILAGPTTSFDSSSKTAAKDRADHAHSSQTLQT